MIENGPVPTWAIVSEAVFRTKSCFERIDFAGLIEFGIIRTDAGSTDRLALSPFTTIPIKPSDLVALLAGSVLWTLMVRLSL
jgi:hypothetical protein